MELFDRAMAEQASTEDMHDDSWKRLPRLRYDGEASLVSQILQVQRCRSTFVRSFEHWRRMTVLSTWRNSPMSSAATAPTTTLYRSPCSLARGEFVAVSYRCDKTGSMGGFRVTAGHGWEERQTKVPDPVLARVVKYVDHFRRPGFWIDQECIDQENPKERERAIQSMDLVYRCSKWPLGVLTTPLRRQGELNLLHKLLHEALVTADDGTPRLACWVGYWTVRRLLDLLQYILSDSWWTRRWIFQEEYCGSTEMHLIIPYASWLTKEELPGFDKIPEEILVNAARFRRQATLFCLACHASSACQTRRDRDQCKSVLRQVKTYRMLRKYSWMIDDSALGRAMSTRILMDINQRAAEKQEDTLAIMANCCGYVVRLNSHKLKAASVSLSVAMIALFLLNGEVMWNDNRSVTTKNVSCLLSALSFNRFDPPVETRALSFMEQCRLVDVRLTSEGMVTSGHLWRVQERVKLPRRRREECQVIGSGCQKLCLERLVAQLVDSRPRLVAWLRQYMHGDAPPYLASPGLRAVFRHMTSVLCEALHACKPLIVASLVDNPRDEALFVSNRRVRPHGSLVFTACQSARYSKLVNKHRSAVKYISLLVATDGLTSDKLPRLQTQAWLNGVCFPDQNAPRNVVFPWPLALQQLSVPSR